MFFPQGVSDCENRCKHLCWQDTRRFMQVLVPREPNKTSSIDLSNQCATRTYQKSRFWWLKVVYGLPPLNLRYCAVDPKP